MTLYRLVYYSANRIGSLTAAAEVDRILEASRRNNQLVGVTGALMFSDGFFGQVLEGLQPAIEATFERIQQDPRHGDVSLLEFAPVTDRSFSDWAMAYVGNTAARWSFPEVGSELDANISGERLYSKLRDMVARDVEAA